MLLTIGERLNATRKSIAAALKERNEEHVREEIRIQIEGGAMMIDINGGTSPEKELDNAVWLAGIAATACDAPLCFDSSNPDVIRAAMEVYIRERGIAIPDDFQITPGHPWLMVNSITMESSHYDKVLPLILQYNCAVTALCLHPENADFSVATRIQTGTELARRLINDGVDPHRIYLDPLVMPLGTDTKNALSTIEVLLTLKQIDPHLRFICGLSNVSHGLPARALLNRTFLSILVADGLDAAILDTSDTKLMASLYASLVLSDKDPYCSDFIAAYRKKRLEDA